WDVISPLRHGGNKLCRRTGADCSPELLDVGTARNDLDFPGGHALNPNEERSHETLANCSRQIIVFFLGIVLESVYAFRIPMDTHCRCFTCFPWYAQPFLNKPVDQSSKRAGQTTLFLLGSDRDSVKKTTDPSTADDSFGDRFLIE